MLALPLLRERNSHRLHCAVSPSCSLLPTSRSNCRDLCRPGGDRDREVRCSRKSRTRADSSLMRASTSQFLANMSPSAPPLTPSWANRTDQDELRRNPTRFAPLYRIGATAAICWASSTSARPFEDRGRHLTLASATIPQASVDDVVVRCHRWVGKKIDSSRDAGGTAARTRRRAPPHQVLLNLGATHHFTDNASRLRAASADGSFNVRCPTRPGFAGRPA